MPSKRVRTCIFLDWHNFVAACGMNVATLSQKETFEIYVYFQERIAKSILRIDSINRHRVTVRVYHGWHSANEKSSDLIKFEKLLLRNTDRVLGNVAFTPDIQLSYDLACQTNRNPLVNSHRFGEQKMVDTSLVSDMFYLLFEKFFDMALVVSDDDDFLPAIFTAEQMRLQAIQLRRRSADISSVCTMPAAGVVLSWGDIA